MLFDVLLDIGKWGVSWRSKNQLNSVRSDSFVRTVIPCVRFLMVRVIEFSVRTPTTTSTSFRDGASTADCPRRIANKTVSNSSWVHGAFGALNIDVFWALTVISSVWILMHEWYDGTKQTYKFVWCIPLGSKQLNIQIPPCLLRSNKHKSIAPCKAKDSSWHDFIRNFVETIQYFPISRLGTWPDKQGKVVISGVEEYWQASFGVPFLL